MSSGNLDYNNESIRSLGEIGGVRKRPESLLGSRGIAGARHTVIEIIGNSLDEKNSGFGEELDVTWFEDGRIAVRDYGRGIPLGYNQREDTWNWESIYMHSYAGGKYTDFSPLKKLSADDWKNITYSNFNEEFAKLGINYLFSVGLNGLGSYATCATSENFVVRSYTNGTVSEMKFHEGYPVYEELKTSKTDEPNGTYIEWNPDPTVFDNVNISKDWVAKFCKSLSYAAGITINFYTADSEGDITSSETYKASNVVNHLANLIPDGVTESGDANPAVVEATTGIYHGTESRITVGADGKEVKDSQVAVMAYEIAISYAANVHTEEFYINNIFTKGGTPYEGFRDAVAGFFRECGKERGIRLAPRDFEGLISVDASLLVNLTSYRGQTKDEIDNEYIYTGINNAVTKMLRHARYKGSPWINEALNRAFESYELRAAAEAMKQESREIKKAISNPVSSRKFQPCRLYNKKGHEDEVELWIVEGDSAGNQLLQSRNSDYQCLYYLRGKGLNPMKVTPSDALKSNKEIADIVNVIGMGTTITDDEDVTKSKIGKVIICSDADKDGYHIRMLSFLDIFVYMPELLYEGRVYVSEPPLWKIDLANGESRFFITDDEYEAAKPELNAVGIRSTHRFKGLGQMNTDEVAETILDPQSRILRQIKVDRDDPNVESTLELLFGKDTQGRKRGILSGFYGEEALDERLEELASRRKDLSADKLDTQIEVETVVMR